MDLVHSKDLHDHANVKAVAKVEVSVRDVPCSCTILAMVFRVFVVFKQISIRENY